MDYKPFPYQQRAIDEINEKFKIRDKILLQAHTGFGKTVVFSNLAKQYVSKGSKVLILCHRSELVDQTMKTLISLGLTCQSIVPSTKRIHYMADVYVAMIETINNRLKKGKFDIPEIDLVVADECHILIFDKVYKYFPNAKILGCTATPVVLKKTRYFECRLCKSTYNENTTCCNEETIEWTKPFTMSSIYEDIVVGAPISELIEFGQLVPEISFVRNVADLGELKVDSSGDYTTKSLDESFGSDDAVFNVLLNYEELCKGKRTIIFNSSTKTNLKVYEQFRDKGYNVKMFDSVNDSGISRKDLVKWFNENDDAILCNVSVFTTGFDSKEVEAIIINRATLSLSLYLQMVGRGGRSSNKIYKDSFIFIDGGDNISTFGEWSSERDWEDIFWNGIGKPKPKKVDIEDVQECDNCGFLMPKNSLICDGCGFEKEPAEPAPKKEVVLSDSVLQPIKKIPPPNGKKIVQYTLSKNENAHFAFRILQNKILDMFIYYRVTIGQYEKAKNNGKLDEKIKKFVQQCYFSIINEPKFKDDSNRTMAYVINKCKEKIERYYYGSK